MRVKTYGAALPLFVAFQQEFYKHILSFAL